MPETLLAPVTDHPEPLSRIDTPTNAVASDDVRWSAPALAFIVVLCLVSLCLGFAYLTHGHLSIDEAKTRLFATAPGLSGLGEDGGNMAAYYLLTHVLVHAFGSSRLVLRSPSVVFGAATVPVVAELGRRVRNVRVGLLGAAFFAVSLPFVAWQQIARAYTLGIFLISLAVLCWLSLARHPKISNAICYVLLTTIASYCLLMNWWVMIAEALWCLALFVSRRERPAERTRNLWLGTSLGVGILCNLGLIEIVTRRGFVQLVPARNHVSLAAAAHTILVLTSSADGLRQPSWVILGGVLALVTASLWAWSLWRETADARRPDRWQNGRTSSIWLLAAWLVVPVLVAAVSSVVLHPIFKPRYFIISLPAAALLTACGLERLARRGVLIYTAGVSLLLAAHLAFLSRLYVH